MRICYVLLSPTYGMHQYTADLANRMVDAGNEVHLVTTRRCPRDAYDADVILHTPTETRNSGFSPDALRPGGYFAVRATLRTIEPDVVHFTGPHLWNVALLRQMRRLRVPTIHSLHDLSPHSGAAYGRLLTVWNSAVLRGADHILVHGQRHRDYLVGLGVAPERVSYTPLLHLFCAPKTLRDGEGSALSSGEEPWALFFGRLEAYKGVADLMAASAMLRSTGRGPRVVVAGSGSLREQWSGSLPALVEVRNRFIGDEEAIDLFRRCALLVLPYRDATQTALIAAAYYFRKPVVVTRVGALPEYVEEGRTGWVVEPQQPEQLAHTLDCALADPSRLTNMGAAGRAWYDRQRKAEWTALLNMYKRVASIPRSRSGGQQ